MFSPILCVQRDTVPYKCNTLINMHIHTYKLVINGDIEKYTEVPKHKKCTCPTHLVTHDT